MKKKQVKKWAFRLLVTVLFITGLLLVIVLNPVLSYANKTTYSNYTVFHNQPLDKQFTTYLDKASLLLRTSEYYDPALKLDICLNDGSVYPKLMKKIRGNAFAWGFYNKVVMQGNMDCSNNYIELNGYKWNLTQLLAHEATHCLQFNALGFWHSNPVASIPAWKWEGYPEYIARQNNDQLDLRKNISLLIATEKDAANNGWIQFADGTGTVIPYYKSWLLVQYCMNIKKLTYRQLLQSKVAEKDIQQEMMDWYRLQ